MSEQSDINIKINYRAALQKWASVTDKSLRESAGKRRYRLEKSVRHSSKLLADIKEFTFRYTMYGAFVDMNVGRGRPIGAAKESQAMDRMLGVNRRRKSKKEYMWYSPTMYRHFMVLSSIVASEYGDLGMNAIKLPEIIELNQ